MKASRILQDIYNSINGLGLGIISTEYTEKDFLFIEEAIKELEAINQDCKQCKYHLSDNGNFPFEPCMECSLFYSSKWESK